MLTRFAVCGRMCPFRDPTPLFAGQDEFSFQAACLGIAQGDPPCKKEDPDIATQAAFIPVPPEGYGNRPLPGF